MGAEAEYEAAISLESKHDLAHMNIGFLVAVKGGAVGAEAEYRTVLALDPKQRRCACNLGNPLVDMGDAAAWVFPSA